jgi:hypothetical protein
MGHKAYKFEAEVGAGEKVEVTLPLPPGARVEVVVLAEEPDGCDDLRKAAIRAMGFWDNPIDDAEWNNA